MIGLALLSSCGDRRTTKRGCDLIWRDPFEQKKYSCYFGIERKKFLKSNRISLLFEKSLEARSILPYPLPFCRLEKLDFGGLRVVEWKENTPLKEGGVFHGEIPKGAWSMAPTRERLPYSRHCASLIPTPRMSPVMEKTSSIPLFPGLCPLPEMTKEGRNSEWKWDREKKKALRSSKWHNGSLSSHTFLGEGEVTWPLLHRFKREQGENSNPRPTL